MYLGHRHYEVTAHIKVGSDHRQDNSNAQVDASLDEITQTICVLKDLMVALIGHVVENQIEVAIAGT